MPVPNLISDLTTTPATNSPAGSESAKGVVDDYLRAHGAFIKQISDVVQGATVTLPSASTVNIGFPNTANIAITGTATINAFDVFAEGALRYVAFQGAMTLTHNPSVLVLPGAANIATVSGDVGVFKSNGAGKWTCLVYQRQSGYVTASQVPGALSGAIVPGLVTMTGRILLADGNPSDPTLSFYSVGGTSTGIYRASDGSLIVVVGGVTVGRFTSTGFESIKVTQTS